MLKLRIERSGTVVLPSAIKLDSQYEVWRDGVGAVLAYAESSGDEYWMHLPGLASYRFSSRGDDISVTITSTAREELVLDAYRRRVLPMALQVCGREVLHASAVRSPAGVLALCADSQTGKSTIAFGLNNRGYSLWADDLVAFEITDGVGQAISLPFEMRLRPSTEGPPKLGGSQTPAPKSNANPAGKETAPLRTICILHRRDELSSAIEVRRLSLVDGVAGVLAHAWCFGIQDNKRKRRMIDHNLPTILDGLEQIMADCRLTD
jgi:hypothetical protein